MKLDIIQFEQLLKLMTKNIYIPKYEVKDFAPETLKDIVEVYKNTGKLIVWSGASENTIWNTPQSNWLFRAWHDFTHIKGLYEFNNEGEASTALYQMSQSGTILARLIDIEVNGQLEYFNKYGRFPENQIEFFKKTFKY